MTFEDLTLKWSPDCYIPFVIWNDVVISQKCHYCDAIMGTVASQITSLTIVYTAVYSDADKSKHQSSASLAFVWGIHRGPVNSPHKWPVTRKMFPFDDVIMVINNCRWKLEENISISIVSIVLSICRHHIDDKVRACILTGWRLKDERLTK